MTPFELKTLRFGAQLKMRELAERLGVTLSLISIWERGKSPIPKKWEKDILRACGSKNETKQANTETNVVKDGSTAFRIEPVQVRMCQTVELGPETMKALADLIDTAVRQIRNPSLAPEVIKAAREGDRYRAKTQEVLRKG